MHVFWMKNQEKQEFTLMAQHQHHFFPRCFWYFTSLILIFIFIFVSHFHPQPNVKQPFLNTIHNLVLHSYDEEVAVWTSGLWLLECWLMKYFIPEVIFFCDVYNFCISQMSTCVYKMNCCGENFCKQIEHFYAMFWFLLMILKCWTYCHCISYICKYILVSNNVLLELCTKQ